MKQRQVAILANIARPMLSSYETGKSLPSLEVLAKLLKALDATLEDLQHCLLLDDRVMQPVDPRSNLAPQIEATLRALDINNETDEEVQFHQAVTSVVQWMVQARSDLLNADTDPEEPS